MPDFLVGLPMDKNQALGIPSVAAGRNLITGQISRTPLRAYKAGGEQIETPLWLTRTNGAISPQMRLALTLDDLIFTGWAFWFVERGADGQIVQASRCPREDWHFDSQGRVVVGSQVVADGILIPGPIPGGILAVAQRTLRAALNVETIRDQRLRTPAAQTEIHVTDDSQLDSDEVAQVRDNYAAALRDSNGSIVVTPAGIEIREHNNVESDYFVEVQNSVAVNIAQHMGIPSALIDAAVSTGSSANLTYANLNNQRSWFLDTTFNFWADPIVNRLSMDDVVPRGTYVAFDLSSLATTPPEPAALED
ncbi:hypothetical protein IU11_13990 [Cellulosimicrobium sp. MM]|nr:phage portal protein [Cellulosimicrobium sp. MM]KFD43148.1 hypothetical protein IU11_13990 [Cellulosimicrobium sp. MM]